MLASAGLSGWYTPFEVCTSEGCILEFEGSATVCCSRSHVEESMPSRGAALVAHTIIENDQVDVDIDRNDDTHT